MPPNDAAVAKAMDRKPKTRKGRAILKQREPKIVEDAKSSLVISGNKCSMETKDLLTDLHRLRSPLSTLYSKPHPIHPFEDASTLVRLCNKLDHGLFAFGSSSKKRPFRLMLGRLFNKDLLDMMEFGVSNYKGIRQFQTAHLKDSTLGSKPMVIFQGAGFENDDSLKRAKSLLLDFFVGPRPDKVLLEGLEHLIVVSQPEAATAATSGGCLVEKAGENSLQKDPAINVRRFRVQFQKSGSKLPRVELVEVGPSFSMTVDRTKDPERERWKQAIKVPKEAQAKKVKNVSKESTGNKRARIHLGKQDFDQIHTVHHGKTKEKKLRTTLGPTKKRAKKSDAAAAEGGAANGASGAAASAPGAADGAGGQA